MMSVMWRHSDDSLVVVERRRVIHLSKSADRTSTQCYLFKQSLKTAFEQFDLDSRVNRYVIWHAAKAHIIRHLHTHTHTQTVILNIGLFRVVTAKTMSLQRVARLAARLVLCRWLQRKTGLGLGISHHQATLHGRLGQASIGLCRDAGYIASSQHHSDSKAKFSNLLNCATI